MTDLIRSFPSAAGGITAEAEMLAVGTPQILLWQAAARAVVMPWHFQNKPGFADGARAAEDLGWPVILRPTGGGAVPQGPGVLNLAMVWPAGPRLTIDEAYHALCAPMTAACAVFGMQAAPGATEGSFCDGTFNLSVGGRKIVGTAQRWRNRAGVRTVLAHAMIMLTPPETTAITAINALHDAMGLTRVQGSVHAGLTEFAPALTPASFATTLQTAARSTLRDLTTCSG